jgi:hypothetical protein
VGQRRDEVAGEVDDPGIALDTGVRVDPGVRPCAGTTGPQHLSDPAITGAEDRQRRRRLVVDARPRGEREQVVTHEADRHEIDVECALRLVDDRPEQFAAVVRCSELLGDAQDTVEALGELGFAAVFVGAVRLRLGPDEHDRLRIDDTASGVSTRPKARASSIAGSHTRRHRADGPIRGSRNAPRQRYRRLAGGGPTWLSAGVQGSVEGRLALCDRGPGVAAADAFRRMNGHHSPERRESRSPGVRVRSFVRIVSTVADTAQSARRHRANYIITRPPSTARTCPVI